MLFRSGLVMQKLFCGVYKERRVLITGHTGFKGSWFVTWLSQMGAKVLGYALDPNTTPNHFSMLDMSIKSVIGDIRDGKNLSDVFKMFQPEIIFHLAAQPLVRLSYNEPVETFQTNIMGTVNVFETCRQTPSVKAVINITSDKCYDNVEWCWGYKETDALGGKDIYSGSKAAAEVIFKSYYHSFF